MVCVRSSYEKNKQVSLGQKSKYSYPVVLSTRKRVINDIRVTGYQALRATKAQGASGRASCSWWVTKGRWTAWVPKRSRAQPDVAPAPATHSEEEMHLSSPQGPRALEVSHWGMGHIAGDCPKTAGPGHAGDVQRKRRETTAENKLIQLHQQCSASCLPAKGDGNSRCPLTISKAARNT